MTDSARDSSPELEKATLRDGAASLGIEIAPLALDALLRFLDLLEAWRRVRRLVGPRDRIAQITHHLIDSLAPAEFIARGSSVLDIGSGAGLPGIPLAIVRQDIHVILVDSRRIACGFMRDAVRRLSLHNTTVVETRIEALTPEAAPGTPSSFDVTIARAWAPVPRFLKVSARYLKAGGIALAMQGCTLDSGTKENSTAIAEFDLLRTLDYALPGSGIPDRRLLAYVRR
jgi:16S rRNA (guanine527-N7)-methyltransferase